MSPVVAVLVLAYVLVRQMQPRPVREQRPLLLPLVLVVIGCVEIGNAAHGHSVPTIAITLLAGSLALNVVLGVARAATMLLWRADGTLLRQGTWLTLSLWLLSIALHIGADAVLRHQGGVAADVGSASVLLSLGLTLTVQRLAIQQRAQRLEPAPVDRQPPGPFPV